MIRSVLAVLAGIAVLTLTSFAIEAAVNPLLLRLFPNALPGPDALSRNFWVRGLTFSYGFACVAAGGFVTALIARRARIPHTIAMGLVQSGLTILAMLSPVGNHASRLQWIATAVLSIPAAWAGGALCVGQTAAAEVQPQWDRMV